MAVTKTRVGYKCFIFDISHFGFRRRLYGSLVRQIFLSSSFHYSMDRKRASILVHFWSDLEIQAPFTPIQSSNLA